MKMICDKAATCSIAEECEAGKEHKCPSRCSCLCEGEEGSETQECVPVKPKRKAVTVWRVSIDMPRRGDGRVFAQGLQAMFPKVRVRGPVKVVLE